jgi:hypothetical protein
VVVLGLLAVDGVISAILAAVFLVQFRVGVVPVPISAVVSGGVNALLVWAGLEWTSSTRWGAIALWTWLLTVAGLAFFLPALTGPSPDLIFSTLSLDQVCQFLLLLFGVVPPGIVLWRARV